ncbi:MAG: maleylacetate reductase [Paracoccaceae bacterium]|nr:MAG: maleylacetate reductase [Paracoccaceae bacterium]
MRPFLFPGMTTRVIFGAGTLTQVPDEVARLGHDRAMILCTPHQEAEAQALADTLGARAAGVFAGAAMHTPVEVTAGALDAYAASGATCVVSLGGGSTTGLGKAIAVRTGADQVVIPTTYAGSEMTDILGETEAGRKTTRREPEIRPETVVYDVNLTLSLPVGMTMTSAFNALAHAMEGLYAPDRNPVTDALARAALPALRDGLPRLAADPADPEARAQVLYAAWCCSTVLGQVSMALHHKLAHVLGGSFDLPHAETHTILLPHATAFNAVAVPDLLAPIAETFGGPPGAALWDFAGTVGAPRALRDLGLTEADLDRAADIAVQNPYANPRPFTARDIRDLLAAAWEGRRPTN